ncbi:hypothetical protein [Vibrio metoecus]|uniref:hypothetical protein n=1 Tax=Vibrio metoecus TaxID=1481663 RepID=UPI000BA9C374|nr:hypothetical protein [Vibrio metoecus]PAR45349.1 hypothetical protein CGT95_15825 [Vibrio metoecus]
MRQIGIFLTISLIFGCASVSNIYDPSHVSVNQLPEDHGVLVLSTGAPESCVSTSTFLKIHKLGEDYFSSELALLGVDSYALKSDFDSHQGNVHALVLPQGNYYLAAWIANPYVEPVKVRKAEFGIKAGEIVYIGEYFMEASCSWDPVAIFNNRYDRDIQLLSIKNQAFAGEKISTRIAKFTGYAVNKE